MELRPIIIRSYKELRLAIAAARKARGLKQLDVDHISGVQSGYTGKLECGDKNFGEMSFDSILGALGMALVLTPAQHVQETAGPRALSACVVALRDKKNGRIGGLKSTSRLTPEQRQKLASKAGRARWARVRNAERERLLRASKGAAIPANA
jgi:hypothetical protein